MGKREDLRQIRNHIQSLYYIQDDKDFDGEYFITRQRIKNIDSNRQRKKHFKMLFTERLHRHMYHKFDYCVCRDPAKSVKLIKDVLRNKR